MLTKFSKLGLAIIGSCGFAFAGAADASCRDVQIPNDKVFLFTDADCKGQKQEYSVGNHPHLGGFNDKVSAIKVGRNVKTTIFSASKLSSKDRSATLWNGNYPHIGSFSDVMSSLSVERVDDNTPVITMFDTTQDSNQNPTQMMHRVSFGDYNKGTNTYELLLADSMSMIFIPQGLKVELWEDLKQQGVSTTFEAIGGNRTVNLEKERWNNSVSSISVDRIGYEMYKISTWQDKKDLPGDEKQTVGIGNTCSNDINATSAVECTINVSYSTSSTASFSWHETTAVSAGVSISENASVGVPGVGEAGEEVTVSASVTQDFGVGGDSSDTIEKSSEVSETITARPGEVVRLEVVAVNKKVQLFPRYHYRPKNSSSSVGEYTKDATVIIDAYTDAETVTNVLKSAALSNDAIIPSISLGTVMDIGERHYTQDKQYFLVLQEDGNLVVYDANSVFVWDSHTSAGTPLTAKHAELKVSGNFVLEDGSDAVIWQTGVENTRAHVAIENRKLKIVDDTNKTLWSH
ncbi:hypothetical protein L53_04365 [Hyphomonas sp. L-53-1-40]|nr:hypothetical protein L53_04365 [Hyphomonas sp. L-53-1-40]